MLYQYENTASRFFVIRNSLNGHKLLYYDVFVRSSFSSKIIKILIYIELSINKNKISFIFLTFYLPVYKIIYFIIFLTASITP